MANNNRSNHIGIPDNLSIIIDKIIQNPNYILELCYFFQGDEGILTAEYTGEAHFGGFMIEKLLTKMTFS